jgi:protein TonB
MNTNAKDKLTPFIATSVLLHGGLFLAVVFAPAIFPATAEMPWGTTTIEGARVGVTDSLPGIPLPSPPVVRDDAKPNESDTLNPPEPEPAKPADKVPDLPPPEIKIPSKTAKPEKKPPPAPPRTASRGDAPPADPTPSNAVPGRGGQIALPYGAAASGSAQASFGGDGTFGTRFPEYVVSMTRAIQLAWQEAGVPRGTPRVYVTFTIGRRGTVSNLEVAQSSGSVQLDNSARRAVMAARIPPLPPAYSGSTVDVRFYFEYTH